MKREKSSDILAEICTEANIRQSITAVLRGSHRKKTKEGRRIIENIDKVTARLIHEISTGSFKISGFTEMHVVEGGKPRTVQSVPLYDRIGVHAIMTVIETPVYPYNRRLDKRPRGPFPFATYRGGPGRGS